MTLISDEEWAEVDAVVAYVTAHLGDDELLEWEAIEKALSSRRTIHEALRWQAARLARALREAVAKIPPPPPPPRPRPMLVRDDASRVAPVLAFDRSRSTPEQAEP